MAKSRSFSSNERIAETIEKSPEEKGNREKEKGKNQHNHIPSSPFDLNLGSQDFDSNKGLEESSPDTGNPYQSNMEGLLSTHIEVVDTPALDPTEIRGSLGKKQEKWKRRARSEIVGNTLVKET